MSGRSAGKTLNAVLFEQMAAQLEAVRLAVGMPIITFALLTEGALLFVAAQTGFIDGPRVLATMATDRWLPRRFSNLSARLVTQDGVLAMGLGGGTDPDRHPRQRRSAGGPVRHQRVHHLHAVATRDDACIGGSERKSDPQLAAQDVYQRDRTACSPRLILMLTLTLKFDEGGWVTVLMTGALIVDLHVGAAHYARVQKAIDQLEAEILPQILPRSRRQPAPARSRAPTAVLLVNGFNGLGLATLTTMHPPVR